MDTHNLTYQLIHNPSFVRWVKGSVQDDAHWQEWMEESPRHKVAVEQARSLVLGVSFEKKVVTEQQINDSWDKLSERIQLPIVPKRNASNNFWQYAAAVVLLVCASIAASYFFFITPTTTHYQTSFGETLKIVLEDGTRVTLNGNSMLQVEEDWLEQQQREVHLQGEAYFTVSSMDQGAHKVPFMVRTPDLKVKVLGTEFNVNSRRGNTQVVLNEGKVALDIPETEEATMSPGDLVLYSSQNKKVTRRQVNPEIYTSWRKQLLVLDDTPVSHIILQLEDTYGVKFVLSDDSIRKRRISSTGSISSADLETVLMAMSTLLQVRIERENNSIYIYEK